MMPPNDDLKQMLRELGKALSAAIADSPEVSRSLRRIRQEGYNLHLLLDCKKEADDSERFALAEAQPVATSEAEMLEPLPEGVVSTPDPDFQIDAKDLSFLRSIGIDPTRRQRRRRG